MNIAQLEKLPNELLFKTIENLSVGDIKQLCRSSYKLSRICNNWYFWSYLSERDFGFPKEKFYVDDPKIKPVDRYQRIENLLSNKNKNFQAAIYDDDLDSLDILLLYYDPSINHNDAISIASSRGYIDIVDRLLQDKRVDPSDQDNLAIIYAAREGHLDVVDRLLQDERVDPSDQYNLALRGASQNGHIDVVDRLLRDKNFYSSGDNEVVITALKSGNVDIVNRLLNEKKIKLMLFKQVYEHIDILRSQSLPDKEFLDKIKTFDVNIILYMCQNGYKLTRICDNWNLWSDLAEKNYNLPKNKFIVNNKNIKAAERYAHIKHLMEYRYFIYQDVIDNDDDDDESLDILLLYMDPSDKDIIRASKNGKIKVVNRLLQDERVDPSAQDNQALLEASSKGHVDVVDRLLRDDRVDPSARKNAAIEFASYRGHIDVVNRLLEDDRVDPSDKNNYSIMVATINGHLDVVNRLLEDSRVNPFSYPNINIMIEWAMKNRRNDIIDRLIQDERFKLLNKT